MSSFAEEVMRWWGSPSEKEKRPELIKLSGPIFWSTVSFMLAELATICSSELWTPPVGRSALEWEGATFS